MADQGEASASSTPQFVAALVVAAVTVGVFTAAWLVLVRRKDLRTVFQPRTVFAPEGKRPIDLPNNIVGFWRTVFSVPDTDIIIANGPDAYLYVRFLKVFGLEMLVPYVILTIAICIPISVISPNNGNSGLNKMIFGNVPNNQLNRHVGHFLVALILIFWTLFLIIREYKHFVEVRQAWLSSPQHLSLARTRTVVVTNLPKTIDSPAAVRELGGAVSGSAGNFGPRPSNVTDGTYIGNGASSPSVESEGGVRQVWLTKKVKPVEKVWEEREKECVRLETGASKLAKLANKNQRKGKTPEAKGKYDAEKSAGSIVDRYVLPKKVPTWKIGFLGLIGEKHTLESSPVYIKEHNQELEKLRADEASLDNGNTAFLRFGSQTEAHAFARLVDKTDKSNRSIRSAVEVVPEDVEWSNISMSPAQRHIRTIISWSLTIGLIIIWAIPVAFVGFVSNIDELCQTASWLAWLCDKNKVPTPVQGIIKGILPPVLLGVLFALLPIVIRLWIRLQGEILKSEIELKLFTRFWCFQIIHGFLIVTLASGLLGALKDISNQIKQLPTLLAEKLPQASIFFLTFILTTTFATAAKAYSRAIPTVLYGVRNFLAGNTPRKQYAKKFKMDSFAWATVWPPVCLLVTLTIVYSVIQPIITILSFGAFIMLYVANKYLLYWVADQPDALETGGLFYIKALRTVFVSLYVEEICLCGLFFLLTDASGGRSTVGLACGAIMAVVIALTAATQIWVDWFGFKRDYLVYAHSSGAAGGKNAGIVDKVGAVASNPSDEEAIAGPEHGNTSGFHARAFDHPALWKAQPVIWLAEDPLGIGRYESARINDAGIESSTAYATMNEKGLIDVERSAPDEAWYGGATTQ